MFSNFNLYTMSATETKDMRVRAMFLYVSAKLRGPGISNSSVDVMQLITSIARLVDKASDMFRLPVEQRDEVAIAVLEDIAKGADGVFGTADDLLDADTLRELKALLQTSFLQHTLRLLRDLGGFRYRSALRRLPFCCYRASAV